MIYNSTPFSVSESPLEGTQSVPETIPSYLLSNLHHPFPPFSPKIFILCPSNDVLLSPQVFPFQKFQHQGKKTVSLKSPCLHPFLCHLRCWKSHLYLQSLFNFLYSSAYCNLAYTFTVLIKWSNVVKDFFIPKYGEFFLDFLYNLPWVISLHTCPPFYLKHVSSDFSSSLQQFSLSSHCWSLFLCLFLICCIPLYTLGG